MVLQVVVLPLLTSFTNAFPDCEPILNAAKDNLARWVEMADQGDRLDKADVDKTAH